MKVLIVGYGSVGKRHVNNLLKYTNSEIIICSKRNDLNLLRKKNVKIFKSLDKCLSEKPDIGFITNETALQPHHLFYKLCQKQGIKILMLNHANWNTLCYISEERHKLDNQHSLSIENSKKYTFDELQKILERSNIAKHHIKFHKQGTSLRTYHF